MGGIGVVAAEQLIPAFTGEAHLHRLRGELRDEVGRDRGVVGERLVKRLDHLREELDDVRSLSNWNVPSWNELIASLYRP